MIITRAPEDYRNEDEVLYIQKYDTYHNGYNDAQNVGH